MVKELVSEFVKEVPPYDFGVGLVRKPFREGVDHVIEMHKNENPFGVSPKAIEAMKAACERANRYPDIRATSLCDKLAALHGIKRENVMVTQGATANLGFIAEMFIRKGDQIIVTPPTYPNYYNLIKKNGGEIVEVPLDDAFEPVFDAMLDAITEKTKLIFLANPNNPTGTICKSAALKEFIDKLPEHVVMVVDEAYYDFVEDEDSESMIDYISDNRNLIVVKTFSKLYGMAGARIGYVMSNKEIIDYLQTDGTGYCCNRMGLEGAEAALEDTDFVKMTIEKNKEGRQYLTEELEKFGFRVWKSHANFLYFDPGMAPSLLADELYTFGINVRGDFSCCRVSIGTMEQNQYFIKSIGIILGELQ